MRVSLVGDITIRSRLDLEDLQLTAAIEAVSETDLAIGNLEMPLSRRGYRVPKWSNMRSDPSVIDDVRALGIQAVSLANNHMMDFGWEAMLDTLAACDGAGIARCGAGSDLDASLEPACLIVGDLRVGLLSVSCTLPVESDAAPGKPGIAPIHVHFSFEVDTNLLAEQPGTMPTVHSWVRQEDQERVCERIAQLRRRVDLVIVAMHWGVPSFWLSPAQGILAEYQQPLAHALVESGADVVCGTHSHSLHPIELFRDKPIFYSLGNFLFEQPRDFMGPESVIARLTMGTNAQIELIPLIIDQRGLPHCAFGSEAEQVLSKLRSASTPFAAEVQVRNGRGYLTWCHIRREG